MTKLDMPFKIAQQIGVCQVVAKQIVQATLDAIIFALGANAAWKTGLPSSRSTAFSLPFSGSQTLVVPSWLAVTTRRPSAENRTESICAV